MSGGKYRTSKCYDLLVGDVDKFTIYKQVSCNMVVPKHRMVFWLASQQKLLTRDHLVRFI